MHEHDEEEERDPRFYTSVFDRLTDGAPPGSLRRAAPALPALRSRLGTLAGRLRDDAFAALGRTRARLAAPSSWRVTWRPSGRLPWDRRSPRWPATSRTEPSLLFGLGSFAFAFTVAWWTGAPNDVADDRAPTAIAATVTPALVIEPRRPQPASWDVAQVLRSPVASEAAKLAVVDELAKDPSDGATKALLAGIGASSPYVSMACLRALSGRPCDAVASALARRLDDPLWQRRAWAARVLGANDCAGAARRLARRLAVEPDPRVQQQIQLAIEALKEPGA